MGNSSAKPSRKPNVSKGGLQAQLNRLQNELNEQKNELNQTVQSLEAHFFSLRMVCTRQVMRLINPTNKGLIHVTPKQIIECNPLILRELGLNVPLDETTRHIFWLIFFEKGLPVPMYRWSTMKLQVADFESLLIDNQLFTEMCKQQRLREYAHIFINVLMYIEEEKDNKAKVVGKIYKIIKDASQATLFHYNFQGVTTSKVDISESFIPPEEYFTEDISLYKIGLKDWLEYLNMNNPEQCNIVRSLYGETFLRLVNDQSRFKAVGTYEELNWLQFVSYMERMFISCFEPPVSHQEAMADITSNIKFKTSTLLQDSFYYEITDQGNQANSWKANTIIYETQMNELGGYLANLFALKNESKDNPSFPKVSIENIFKSIQDDGQLGSISPLLNFFKINIAHLKSILELSDFHDKYKKKTSSITIETFIMAIKLIDFGDAIFLNVKNLIVGNSISEDRLVEWMEMISSTDSICGDYESKEFFQYRRFLVLEETLNDKQWKIMNKIPFDEENLEFLFSHEDWNFKVIPKCLSSFHYLWESEIDEMESLKNSKKKSAPVAIKPSNINN